MASLAEGQNPSKDLLEFMRQLLVDELGLFKNGRQAIAVEPPQVPTSGTGLHITIARQAQQLTSEVYTFKVTLVQFDLSEIGYQKFDTAVQKIRSAFVLRSEYFPAFQENLPVQAVFLINGYQTFHTFSIA